MARLAALLLAGAFLLFLAGAFLLFLVGPLALPSPSEENAPARDAAVRSRVDAEGEPLPYGAVGRLGSVRIWRGEVRCIAFSPDGRLLAAGGDDRLVRVWDVRTGRERQVFPAYRQPIRCLAFSPDGKMLAVGGGTLDAEASPVLLWDVVTGKEKRRFRGLIGDAEHLAFSPDGRTLIGDGGSNLCLWETATGKESELPPGIPRNLRGWVSRIVFSPDGKALGVLSKGEVLHIDLRTEKLTRALGKPRNGHAVTFTPDGKALASAGSAPLRMWRADTGKETLPFGERSLDFFAFSPDGKTVAWSDGGKEVFLGELASSKLARPLLGHRLWVNCVAFSPDGRLIATGSDDGTVLLWDAVADGDGRRRAFTLTPQEAAQLAHDEDEGFPVPAGAQVVAEFDREEYFLGENILVHFRLENVGKAPFPVNTGGDYRGATRPLRYSVTATDEHGKEVPDPNPHQLCFGGISSTRVLKPGERFQASLQLTRFCRFDKPGVYRVRVSHGFGWRWAGKRDHPVAEATVRLVMPTKEQAKKVVEAMYRLPKDHGGTVGERRKPFADFTALSYPVYLPVLAARAAEGCERALEGLASIPTPEATAELVKLLGHKDAAFARKALEVLKDRLPHPRLEAKDEGRLIDIYQARRRLVKQSWRPEHAPAACKAAGRLLRQDDLQTVRLGADVLECVGRREDVAALADALGRVARLGRRPAKEEDPYPRPRIVCRELMTAAGAMSRRGVPMPAAPRSAGELLLFAAAVDTHKESRPEGWEDVCARLLRHELPMLREAGLRALPLSPPRRLREAVAARFADADTDVQTAACQFAERTKLPELREPVLRLLQTATEVESFKAANSAARALGARAEPIDILVSRLDEEGMTAPCLQSLVYYVLKDYSGGSYPTREHLDAAAGRACKAAWQKFLKEHGERLKAGKRFKLSDPSLPLKELFPKFEFSPPRGG